MTIKTLPKSSIFKQINLSLFLSKNPPEAIYFELTQTGKNPLLNGEISSVAGLATHWFVNRETHRAVSLSAVEKISAVFLLPAHWVANGEISSVCHIYIPCIAIGDVSSMGII